MEVIKQGIMRDVNCFLLMRLLSAIVTYTTSSSCSTSLGLSRAVVERLLLYEILQQYIGLVLVVINI